MYKKSVVERLVYEEMMDDVEESVIGDMSTGEYKAFMRATTLNAAGRLVTL